MHNKQIILNANTHPEEYVQPAAPSFDNLICETFTRISGGQRQLVRKRDGLVLDAEPIQKRK